MRPLTADEITIGMSVRYHPIIGEPHDDKLYTVREIARIPSSKTPVVWLYEKNGCVAIEALSRPLKLSP